jgi:hypothetical protein
MARASAGQKVTRRSEIPTRNHHAPNPTHRTPPTARRTAGRSHTQLLPFSRCARFTPLPSLRFRRPFAARRTRHARDTGVCVPFPSAPLFARHRALSPGVHWPCRARAPRSAPVRARCARTHLQRGAMHREGVPCGGGGAAHARARALPRRTAPPVRALDCVCGLLTVRSRCSAALRRVFSRAPWWQHPCTSALTTVVVRSQRACGAERADRTAVASWPCALPCADA